MTRPCSFTKVYADSKRNANALWPHVWFKSGLLGAFLRKYWRGSLTPTISEAGLDEYPLPDPTRTFVLLPEPDPNYFSKSPSIGFFSTSCFPAGRFKSFNNNPQILLFSSRPDTKSSVSRLKCLRYKKWTQGKSWKFDNWFMMPLDLIFQSRQSNPRFNHVEAIKSINHDGDKLLSDEAHAL